MSPITIKKEIPGFVLNRLQYALFTEAYKLVEVKLFLNYPLYTDTHFSCVIN